LGTKINYINQNQDSFAAVFLKKLFIFISYCYNIS